MKTIWVLVSAVLIQGCGKAPTLQVPDFGKYDTTVFQFVSDASHYGHVTIDPSHLVIQSRALPATVTSEDGGTETNIVDGTCDLTENGPVITLNTYLENNASAETIQATLYHEMGHCLLHRAHRNDLETDNTPVSIMNAGGISGDLFTSRHAQYLNELFSLTGNVGIEAGGITQ